MLPRQEDLQPGGDVHRAAAADGAAQHPLPLHAHRHPVAHHLPQDPGLHRQHHAEADRQAGEAEV